MKKSILKLSPLLISLFIFGLLVSILFGQSIALTRGQGGYPLDDTYIHMAIARHFVEDGSWSVTQGGFTSSTSSPVWTFLVALAYRLGGVNDETPLALGLIIAALTLVLCYALLRAKFAPFKLTMILVGITLLAPLPILALMGMEHLLHGLLTLGLIYGAASTVSGDRIKHKQWILLLFCSASLTLTRYEGLFLVAAVCLMLCFFKYFGAALAVGAAGTLPVALYGWASMKRGWYFFPNSILLKGHLPELSPMGISSWMADLLVNLAFVPHLLGLLAACVMVYGWGERRSRIDKQGRIALLLYLMITILHLLFAGVGWFYRYEAYLMLVGSVILADLLASSWNSPMDASRNSGDMAVETVLISAQSRPSATKNSPQKQVWRSWFSVWIRQFRPSNFLLMLLVSAMLWPAASRTRDSFRDYPLAVKNIYEQQVQMGLFLKQFYVDKRAAANDIGAVNYFADIYILDLFGLSSMDVLQAKRSQRYNQVFLRDLVQDQQVDVIIIYNAWFAKKIPPEWIEVGRWQIMDNVVCGSDTVSFYAPSAGQQAQLTANLKQFSDSLPASVRQTMVDSQ